MRIDVGRQEITQSGLQTMVLSEMMFQTVEVPREISETPLKENVVQRGILGGSLTFG